MNRLSQAGVGPTTRDPGTAAGPTPTARHDMYGRELATMLELVRSGQAFTEQATAERLSVRLIGVLTRLHDEHDVDEHGRCLICRPHPRRWWHLWPRRVTCTVHAAFAYHLPHAATPDPQRAR